MVFRCSKWWMLGGLLMPPLVVGACWGYWWVATVTSTDSELHGKQLLLLLLSPLIAGCAVYLLYVGIQWMVRGLEQYVLAPDSVTRRLIRLRRTIAWSDVVDFALPEAHFPYPPRSVRLMCRDGRSMSVPLTLCPRAELREKLMEYCPRLRVHGLDQARKVIRKEPSVLRVRWRRHASELAGLFGGLVFLLLSVGGVAVSARDFINFVRIRMDGESAPAKVIDIEEGDKRVSALVEFHPGGRRVVLRRDVKHGTSHDLRVGDQVTVDHLAGRPRVGRIRHWDVDQNQWIMVLLLLPLLGMCCVGVRHSLACWLRPLRSKFAWVPVEGELGYIAALGKVGLETTHALCPERHLGGSLVFTRVFIPGQSIALPPAGMRRMLKRAGIEARVFAAEWLIVEPDAARRMFQRLGGSTTWRASYAIVPGDAHEVEKCILDGQGRDSTDVGPRRPALICTDGAVGPLDREEMAHAFDRLVRRQFDLLFDGWRSPAIENISWATLLGIDAASQACTLLAERGQHDLRLWLRREEQSTAECASWRRGRWMISRGHRPPALLRDSRPIVYWIFFGPMMLISGAALVVASPLIAVASWFEGRQRSRKVEKAREQLRQP